MGEKNGYLGLLSNGRELRVNSVLKIIRIDILCFQIKESTYGPNS